MQRALIDSGKQAVFNQDHQMLKDIYAQSQEMDYQLNLPNIFLKLFYHACQYDRKTTIIFLFQMYFEIFSEAEQIALRQSFYYGKYQLKQTYLVNWYDKYLLPIVKIH